MNEDYLPLSYLNQYVYCPRRFWLMYVQCEMEVNAPLLEGIYRHQNAHRTGVETDEHGRRVRSVTLWSHALRLTGVADFIEERDGELLPLEHKRGRMGRWLNDHIQLCAQAICLEERTGERIAHGEIFYWQNRRRERVELTVELREHTRETAQRIHRLLGAGRMPTPIDHTAKCRDCSLKRICLPKETRKLLAQETSS